MTRRPAARKRYRMPTEKEEAEFDALSPEEQKEHNRQAEIDERDAPGYVYFFLCDHRVKIGFSGNPKERLRQMQTATAKPVRILLVMQARASEEKRMHNRFARLCIRGEWFEYSGALERFIKENAPGVVDPKPVRPKRGIVAFL